MTINTTDLIAELPELIGLTVPTAAAIAPNAQTLCSVWVRIVGPQPDDRLQISLENALSGADIFDFTDAFGRQWTVFAPQHGHRNVVCQEEKNAFILSEFCRGLTILFWLNEESIETSSQRVERFLEKFAAVCFSPQQVAEKISHWGEEPDRRKDALEKSHAEFEAAYQLERANRTPEQIAHDNHYEAVRQREIALEQAGRGYFCDECGCFHYGSPSPDFFGRNHCGC